LTGRGFVEFIQKEILPGLKYSRFRKDRARRKAPEPVAHFGNHELFTEEQAPADVDSMITKADAAGRIKARAEGRTGGRRRKMTPQDITAARKHMTDGKLKAHQVAAMYGISERSLWRNLRWAQDLEKVRAG
jgi:hypothetical protein